MKPIFLLGTGLVSGILLALAFQHLTSGNSSGATSVAAREAATQSPHSIHSRTAVMLDEKLQQRIGIRLEEAKEESISEPLRTVASVAADEGRIFRLHARTAGWIEELPVGTAGQQIRKGDAVARIYSQELLSTQEEYLATISGEGNGPGSTLAASARRRLALLGMGEIGIDAIEKSRKPQRLVTLTAPSSGTILSREISAGSAIDPSTEIIAIADLSRVWVWAELPGNMAGKITIGARARLEFPGSGLSSIPARVDFIAPTLAEGSRSLQARFTLSNQNGMLRPGLAGTATFDTATRKAVLVPRDAVVDTGLGEHLFIAHEGGHFEPRAIRTGARVQEKIEVLEGVTAGERLVAAGVFLLDSESRLQASGGAGSGHSGHGGHSTSNSPPAGPESEVDHSQMNHGAMP